MLAVALLARIAAADAVVLRDGSRLSGTVTMCDEEGCSIAGKRVMVEEIARIELVEGKEIPASAGAGSVVLANGTVRHGTFTALNLGYVWIGEEEIERSEVAAVVLLATPMALPTPPPAGAQQPLAELPSVVAAAEASEAHLLLNEMRLSTAEDAPGFVELINRGGEAVHLEGWSVRNDK